jgi:hypothetical protein
MNQGRKLDYISAVDMYGSTINGLALKGNSDLDLTITIDEEGINDNSALKAVRKALDTANDDAECPYYFSNIRVFQASFGD